MKVCMNEKRTFVRDVTAQLPNGDGGHDPVLMKVLYNHSNPDEEMPVLRTERLALQVADIVNLDDFLERDEGVTRDQAIQWVLKHDCFSPAIEAGYVHATVKKNQISPF